VNTSSGATVSTFTIKVQKDENAYPDEAPEFVDGNIAGVLQKVGSKARWGNEFYNYGTGSGGSGGYISNTIGTNMSSLITDLQNTHCNTWTPLAEAYYVATQYFKQQDVQSGLDYPNNAVPDDNAGQDPYYNGTEYVECAKSFVILITDGTSTMDQMIPDFLKNYDGDTHETDRTYPDSGSDYLDDIALYARTNDLRSDLSGDQNLYLYAIYADFGSPDSTAENLLKDSAINGGFEDRNGNNRPDLQEEWDKDGDGVPDTYYQADNGYELETKLIQAVNDILSRAAAGSAVSVLATTGEGEGNMYQAYFRPVVPVGTEEVDWVGYLQSLWVDPKGNLREDTNGNLSLDLDSDKIVSFYLDAASGDTMIKRYAVSSTTPYPDLDTASYETIKLSDLNPVWEAGKVLAGTDPSERHIFTYLDKDDDKHVDETSDDPFDHSGEVVSFDTSSAAAIKPFLGVKDNSTWSYLGATQDDRVNNLINYIRGTDISGLRPRTIDGQVWKLGDIVDSTPVPVSKPVENYNTIYSDESYQTYCDKYKDRETVVYVGANDGMLHAFTSWNFNSSSKTYEEPSAAGVTEQIGQELWAYIPQCLLPHLKWLADPNYTHVDYVDLKPKVFDAKILPDDTHYTDSDSDDNWGTFVLVGLNMGGKHIWSDDDFDYNSSTADTLRNFYPSYSLIDVTDPRNPRLIWERSYQGLNMTTSFPTIVRVKNKWFAVFGSGPSDYDGTSSNYGHIFVVDLKTGAPYQNGTNDYLFQAYENKAFMNSPSSLDKNLNDSVDAIYFGESYLGSSWKGKLYKVEIPALDTSGNYDDTNSDNYVDNPTDPTNPWVLRRLFDSPTPITAPIALSVDSYDNAWVYVGTGRYMSTADKSTTDTQYMFGIKDPFFNKAQHTADGYYHNYATELELGTSNLFDADPYVVIQGGDVYKTDDSYFGSFNDLVALARGYDGWMKSLSIPGERIITKFSILGGIVFTPSFVPNGDICGFGGDSYLYGQYYETGTAYYQPVFNDGTSTVTINGNNFDKVLDKIQLGGGKASAVGIHVGTAGAKALIQQSTGTVVTEQIHPAFNIKSGLRSWKEK
jgi:type IV pilus assembly protein PilY1